MKEKMDVRKITLTGMFIGMGLLIPYVTSHAFGIAGTVLLPMHFTIFLAGFLCGPLCGGIAGVITPLLSSLLTGMPSFFPMLPVMSAELFIYGFLCGKLYPKKRPGLYGTLIIAMIAGRIVHGAVWSALLLSKGAVVTFASASAFVVEGIPGTILQLILIPVIVRLMEKEIRHSKDVTRIVSEDVLIQAKNMIHEEKSSFIVIKKGRIIYQDSGNGVKPILKVLETDRELLRDAIIVDKIIGKAAAMLLVLGQVKMVYGVTMSESGKEYLEKNKIANGCEKCIGVISNRKKDGICPLERAVADIDDPEIAYEELKKTIAQLMRNAG